MMLLLGRLLGLLALHWCSLDEVCCSTKLDEAREWNQFSLRRLIYCISQWSVLYFHLHLDHVLQWALVSLIIISLKLSYDWRSVSQSILVSGSHLETITRLFFISDKCRFLGVGCPFEREDGSEVYPTIASGPCQSSHSLVQVPQNSLPYFAVSFETPPTWSARSPYLYTSGTGWPSYTPGHWIPLQGYGGGILTRLYMGQCSISLCFS
jgi:hypothetical protein